MSACKYTKPAQPSYTSDFPIRAAIVISDERALAYLHWKLATEADLDLPWNEADVIEHALHQMFDLERVDAK